MLAIFTCFFFIGEIIPFFLGFIYNLLTKIVPGDMQKSTTLKRKTRRIESKITDLCVNHFIVLTINSIIILTIQTITFV